MRVMTIFGTRPEMIKLWSTMKKLDSLGFDHITVHTGQNFSPEMKDFFFRDLGLRAPDHELNIDTSSYGREVADVIAKSDDLMERVKPDALLILGDTFSGLAVMPAAHRGIKVYHMEAGLRAWDSRMPEQRNRVLIDHLSHVNLPYHERHRDNLLREGLHPSRIFVTGNPTFEAMRAFRPQMEASPILGQLGLEPDGYILATAHRSEAVDVPQYLGNILAAFGAVAERTRRTVLFTVHPRTRSKLDGFEIPAGVKVTPPFGFFDFNKLLMECHCFVSDSGTAPEEALFYKKPCVTLRMAMERPETIEAAGTIVSGLDPANVVESVVQAVTLPFTGRYQLEEGFDPSTVVVNVMRSRITNFW